MKEIEINIIQSTECKLTNDKMPKGLCSKSSADHLPLVGKVSGKFIGIPCCPPRVQQVSHSWSEPGKSIAYKGGKQSDPHLPTKGSTVVQILLKKRIFECVTITYEEVLVANCIFVRRLRKRKMYSKKKCTMINIPWRHTEIDEFLMLFWHEQHFHVVAC